MACPTWKKWLAVRRVGEVLFHHVKQLSEDATCGPDVDSKAINIVSKDDFRGTIPSSDHMLGQTFAKFSSVSGFPWIRTELLVHFLLTLKDG